MKPIKVLFLCSEAAPLIKVGGLGDVAGSLPGALRALPGSPDVRVCLPLYNSLLDLDLNLTPVATVEINYTGKQLRAKVFESSVNNVPFYFFSGLPIDATNEVYSSDNHQDGKKFTFFSLAALEFLKAIQWMPDILHAQDWHTAPAVYHLARIRGEDVFYHRTRSLLTVHNLPYLGQGTEEALLGFGLPPAQGSALPKWARGLPLPLGLLTADKINTVSPGYASEMLTPEFGAGLEIFLKTRQSDLRGILNGLDLDSWDPENDPHLPYRYGANSLRRRDKNKSNLQAELGLAIDPDTPLLAMINRLDHQKGVDLVPAALRTLQDLEWQAVLLGTGDPILESTLRTLGNDYPQIAAVLQYDSSLARRIYGGSDLILIPSRYEPCGLTQMIGMRYGCVPLARSTGGLQDTIIDYHSNDRPHSTGFLFQRASGPALAKAIRRGLEVYQDKRRWGGLQRRGMKTDFSWEKSAGKYFELYEELINSIED
jgi:starch synthase